MADTAILKTWIVKTFFRIPMWYVISQSEEDRLFNYIITEQRNAYMARALDCSTICDGRDCYFCCDDDVSPLCASCVSFARPN